MASPLSALRKYQFAFFVFFGVVCMLVFVVGDPLDTWLRSRSSGSSRSENKVVVRWNGGEFHENEIDYARSVRHVIREFMQTLLSETQKKNGSPRVRVLQLTPGEEDIVYTRLFAQRAEKIGMVASDETALLYLEQLTNNLIPRVGIGQIFKETVGNRISEQQLLAEIKTALLAENYLSLTYPDLSGQLPAQAWEYHLRLNRRLKTEVVPINVADFKSKVKKQATEAEIAALYDQGKDRYPEPTSPEPGFKRHRKAAFEFVRADRKKFEDEETAKAKPQVSDQEIKDYYDKNKESFRIPEAAPVAPQPDPSKPDATKPDATKPDATKPDATKPDATKPDAAKSETTPAAPGSTEKKDDKKPDATSSEKKDDSPPSVEKDATKPDENKPTEEKKDAAEKKDAEKEPEAEKKESDKKLEEGKEPKADETNPGSSCGEEPAAAVQEGATQERAKEPAEPAAPAAPPATEKKAADPPAAPDKKEDKKEEPKPNPTPPAATDSPPPVAPTPTAPSPTAPAPSAPGGTPAAVEKPEPKYKPFDDNLKEEIRKTIAEQKAKQAAQQRIDKGFEEIKRAVEKYSRDKRSAELTNKPAPPPLDLANRAEKHGMTAGSIPLSDPKQVQETDLGKTQGFDFSSMSSMSFEPIPFHVLAYRDKIPLFTPDQIRGNPTDSKEETDFLYWKTKEEEPFVPKLADIRDEVVDSWKMREALTLAEAEAKRLAEAAKQSGKPLKEAFADNKDLKVVETSQFTWMTRGMLPASMGGSPTLSSIDNVNTPGNDFMQAVFKLKTGEVGTAVNHPKSVVYVVRVENEMPSEEVLREQFLQTGNNNDLRQIATFDRIDLRESWIEGIKRDMNVKWEREPQS